jgi:hypothetical protein
MCSTQCIVKVVKKYMLMLWKKYVNVMKKICLMLWKKYEKKKKKIIYQKKKKMSLLWLHCNHDNYTASHKPAWHKVYKV